MSDKNEHIKVGVRVRPLTSKEEDAKFAWSVNAEEGTLKQTLRQPGIRTTRALHDAKGFNYVWGPESTTKDVFEDVAAPIVESVMNGINGMSSFVYPPLSVCLSI
jgi:Kinesin motor domain